MYKTKKDVDAYVRSESSKILSATEFHLLKFTIAKLYYQINEFATAQQYLCCCLDIKEDNDEAHKLLGQCYQHLKKPDKALQSFQRSLQLNPKQSDILAEVCQLMLEDTNLNTNEARYWCELAESEKVQNEAVFALRLKLINQENLETNQVEEFIQKEIAARPNDVQLRVKLVRYYIENNQILDAFKYVHQLEMSQKDEFVTSGEWYNVVWLVLNKYEQMPNTKNDWDFWLLLAMCLERQVQISFSLPSKPTTIGGGVTETENLLLNLDQYLFKISQLSDKFYAQRELVELFLDHYRGQLLLHATVLIFKRGRFHNKSQWKETTRAVLPLLLLAYQIAASNNKAPWMKHCDKQIKQLITLWQREGSFRCAQVGRTLLSCVDDNGVDKENAHNINNLLGSQSSGLWQSNDELLNQARQTCSDPQWRRNIFALLFCNSDQKVKEQSSLFAKSSKLSEPIYEMPSYADVECYEDAAQYLRPQSLQHMVYLCLGNENLAYVKAKYFSGLNYSTQNLSFCGAGSLNQLDVDSFLYAAIIQAKRALEVDSSALGKPKLLPFVNIQNLLCTKEQSQWWNAAYIVYKNLSSGNDLAELRANLQYGIEAVRGINGPKLDMAIAFKLSQIFVARAQDSVKPIEKAYLEARAESIYKYGLNMMKMPNGGVLEPFRKYFKYVKSQTPAAEHALVSAAEDAVSYLATRYFKRSEYEDLIAELSGIQLPFATYLQAEAYRKLDEASKTPKKTKRMYLNHAIVCLNQTLALFKSSNHANSNHLLHSLIHSEIKRLQQTSARYSNDSSMNFSPITGHNNSSNYEDAEPDFYAENSIMPPESMVNATRSRRDTLSANAILSSHNQEIETPVKQIANTLTIFKDEIINNLKSELQNITREIRTLKDKISSFEEAWYQNRQQTSPPSYMGVSQSRNMDGTITNGLDMISNSQFMSQRQCLQAMLPPANVVITNSDPLSNPKPTTNFVTSAPVPKSDDTSGSRTKYVFGQQISATTIITTTTISSTPSATAPASKLLYSGLNLSTKVSTSNDNSHKSTTVTTTSASSFANFSFGNPTAPSSISTTPLTTTASSTVASKTGATITSTTSPFASIFSNLSSSPFINPTSNASVVSVIPTIVNDTAAGSALNKFSTSDTEDDYVPTAQLNPVIPLPDFVKVNTGEENEIVLFFHRAKLFRFDKEAGEWKERGLGIIKLLQDSDDLNKVRLVMRREQIHKLCCNQRVYKDTSFKYAKNSQTALSWAGQDFSENELVTEMLTVRFKLPETSKQFLEIIQDAQAKMTSEGEEANSNANEKKNDATEYKPTKGFGDAFKPKVGSWSCNTCYIRNDADQFYCVACDTPKDDTVPKKEVTSNILASSSNTKFSFGFSAASSSSTISAPTQSQSSTVKQSFGFITPTTTSTAVSSELNEKMSSTKPPATGGFGDAFKPKAGSWSCNTCYIRNDADQLYCVACDTPKDDTVPKKEVTSNILASSSNTKFSFGFSAASSSSTISAPTQSQSSTVKQSFGFITPTTTSTAVSSELNEKMSSTKPPATGGFGDAFKPKAGSWSCNTCYIRNDADQLYCVACDTPKDDTVPKKEVTSNILASSSNTKFSFGFSAASSSSTISAPTQSQSSTVKQSFGFITPTTTSTAVSSELNEKMSSTKPPATGGFGDAFKPKAGSWSCNTCYIRNDADQLYCVACDTPKDDTVPKKEVTSNNLASSSNTKFSFGFSAASSSSTISAPTQSQSSTVKQSFGFITPTTTSTAVSSELNEKMSSTKPPATGGFGDAFKPKAGSWSCNTCYIRNDADQLYCVACDTPKDDTVPKKEVTSNILASSSNTKFSFGFSAASSSSTISAPTQSQSSTVKQSFGFITPTTTSTAVSSELNEKMSSTKPPATGGFGDAFKPKAGSWSCNTCYIRNDADQLYCVACDTPKDDTVPKKEVTSNNLASSSNTKFSFGFSAASSSSTISAPTQSQSSTVKQSFGFITPTTTSTAVSSELNEKMSSTKPPATGGFGDAFKPKAGSWSCNTCYIRNDADQLYCVACDTPKDDTVPKKEVTSNNLASSSNTKFSFGFSAASSSSTISAPTQSQSSTVKQSFGFITPTTTSTAVSSELNEKMSSTKPPATGGFGDAFKPKAGSWSCNTCYIRNDADQFYCVACDTPKDDTVPKKEVTSNNLASSSNTKFSFGFSAASSSSTISAPTQSQSSTVKQSFGFITPTTTSTAVSSELNEKMSSTKPPATGGFGDAFKPKAGSWSCNTCYIRNDADQFYCVACDTPKDDTVPKKEVTSNNLASSSNTKFSFGFSAASSSSTISAPTQSQSSTVKQSFGFITPTTTSTAVSSELNEKMSSTKPPATGGFGDAFKPKAGSWSCNTCYIRNDADQLYCVACDTPKDDTVPKKEVTSNILASSSNTKFSFGFSAASSSSTISAPTQSQSSTVKQSFGFITPTTTSTAVSSELNEKMSSTKPPATGGFGDAFKPKAGSWSCNTCYIRNDADQLYCVACDTPKDDTVPKKEVTSNNLASSSNTKFSFGFSAASSSSTISAPTQSQSSTVKQSFGFITPTTTSTAVSSELNEKMSSTKPPATGGFGDAFKPKAGSWSCNTCYIRNDADQLYCVACDTPKDDTVPKKEVTSNNLASSSNTKFSFGFSAASSSSTISAPTQSQSSTVKQSFGFITPTTTSTAVSSELNEKMSSTKPPATGGFGDAFKPKAGSWSCNTCYIRNDADQFYCVACDTPKDDTVPKKEVTSNNLASSSNTKFSFGFSAASSSSTISAPTQSQSSTVKQSFGFITPTTTSTAVSSELNEKMSSTKPPATGGFGDAFKPKAGSWSCNTCYIRNDADQLYCVACDTPKDDTVPKKEVTSNILASSSNTKFSFGFSAASSSSTISAPTQSQSSTVKQSFGFITPTTTSTAVSSELNEKMSSTKPPATGGFGDAFKPKAGSWSCNTCYIRNDADQLYCVACDTPKDDTVPKKEVTSNILASSSNTKFSFGFSAASSSSTISAPTQSQSSTVKPSFEFITSPAISTSLLTESNKKMSSTKHPASDRFGDVFKTKTDSWTCQGCHLTNSAYALYCKACCAPKDDTALSNSTEKFYFGPLYLGATQPVVVDKSAKPFKFIPSTTSTTLNVASIPTGEEVMFYHSARLLHVKDMIWKEPNIGDIAILKSNDGTSRILIRRDYRLNICANHKITHELTLTVPKNKTKGFIWTANDFAEGSLQLKKFYVCFKSPINAQTFQTAFIKAQKEAKDIQSAMSANNVEKSKEILNKGIPFALSKSTATNLMTSTPAPKNEYNLVSQPQKVFGKSIFAATASAPSSTASSSKSLFSDLNLSSELSSSNVNSAKSRAVTTTAASPFANFTFRNWSNPSGISSTFASISTEFAKNLKKLRKEAVEKQSAMLVKNVAKSKVTSTRKSNTGRHSALAKSTATNLVTSTPALKNEYSLESQPQKVFGQSIFAATATAPSTTASSSKSLFSDLNLSSEISSSNVNSAKSRAVTTTAASPFVNFSFGNWSTPSGISSTSTITTFADLSKTSTASTNLTTKSSSNALQSLDKTSTTFADLWKTATASIDFASLAKANTSTNTNLTPKSNEKSGFIGLTNQNDFSSFGKPLKELDSLDKNSSASKINESQKTVDGKGEGAGDSNDENCNPHYVPVIELPNKVIFSTLEEEETKLFGERAFLFRWDANNKEIKESGVGELKILLDPVKRNYRLVMRCVQIHKLVLNHAINADFHFDNMNNNPKSFVWETPNYAESNEGELEKLAVRFCKLEIAETFSKILWECIDNCKERAKTN